MKRFLEVALAHRLLTLVIVATVASLSLPGSAAAQPGSVAWGQGQPVGGVGQVSGSGTYKAALGNKATAVQMTAVLIGGGAPSTVVGAAPAGGNWGPITIKNLPKGQYVVQAQVTFTNILTGKEFPIVSPTVIVTVQ